MSLQTCFWNIVQSFVGIFLHSLLVSAVNDIRLCEPKFKNSTYGELSIPRPFMKSNYTKHFSFTTRDLNCSSSAVTFKTSNSSEPYFYFLTSGDIVVPGEEYFLTEEYCISRFDKDIIEIKHCEIECGVTHTCIYKCCQPNEIVDFSHVDQPYCSISNTSKWKPYFYDKHQGCGVRTKSAVNYHLLSFPESEVGYGDIQPYKHIQVNMSYDDKLTIVTHEGLRFRLMKEGYLMSQEIIDGKWVKINQADFCIDGMTGYIGSKPYQNNLDDQMFLLRNFFTPEDMDEIETEEGETENEDVIEQIYIVLMFIGSIFLLLTCILYLLIWEKHNIHGWTIFAFVTTMLFMFIFLATAIFYSRLKTQEFGGTASCKSVGILAHFFYLSTMCWLTVINADIYLTFRNITPSAGTSQSLVRFILYCVFAFGIPFLIVGFALSLDYIYEGGFGDGTECEPPFILPLYGIDQCYIRKQAYWPYLYIPMSILLSCNILTFSSTVITLCLYRRKTRHAVSNTNHQQESIVLFGKLFIVTGISWVLELISNTFPGLWWLWLIFDAYNLLQAVLIFMIFAAKRENLLYLYHKYPRARPLLTPIMRTPCCYSQMFDPERTEMTGVPYDFRNSRISFRRGSNLSTSAMISSTSAGRRGSEDY